MSDKTETRILPPQFCVSRRGLLRGVAGVGALAATMPLSRVAWAADGKAAADGKTKILRARGYADLDHLDPGYYGNAYDVDVMNCLYSKLIHYKPGRKWGWELQAAESIEQVDPTHIRFKLRRGLMFTDGYGEMTADDVKFSFERIIKHNSPMKGDWATLDHVEVEDPYTGVIVLKSPFQPLWNITLPYGAGHIVSKKAVMEQTGDGGDFGMKPPCFSGPYVLAKWEPNQYTLLKRNSEYTGPGRPEFDEIRIIPMPDDQTANIAYEAGDIDFTGISLASYHSYKQQKPANTKIEPHPSLYYVWVGMNMDHPKLRDINVRRAVQWAINVPQILQLAYFGEAKPATGMIAPGLIGHRKQALIPPEGDIAKAREYLKKAGVDGLGLTISAENSAKWKSVAQVVQAQLGQIGIDLQINVMDYGAMATLGMESKGDRWKDVQLILNRFSMVPDPYYATQWFTCEQVGIWNWERFCSERFDQLNKEAVAVSDPDKRAKMYREMQDIMEQSGAYRFLTNEGSPVMYRDTVLKPAVRPDGRPLYRFFQGA